MGAEKRLVVEDIDDCIDRILEVKNNIKDILDSLNRISLIIEDGGFSLTAKSINKYLDLLDKEISKL